ncbi:hypothetical protein [Salimicrobium jeotgali]|nr:hypothetical protein [Salimicrobium jeotgali]MBM7696111.1 hypothetical protein [Salimicrobium jeotgali]
MNRSVPLWGRAFLMGMPDWLNCYSFYYTFKEERDEAGVGQR